MRRDREAVAETAAAGRAGARRGAGGGVRPQPCRGRGRGHERPAVAGRGGRPARRGGRGVPRAATCPRTGASSSAALRDGAAARAGRHQRARAGHRRQRPRRGGDGRLAGHAARRCGSRRAGPARGRTVAGGDGGRRRPAGHLPGAPPGGDVRPAGRGGRPRPAQPLRAGPAPGRGRGRAAAHRGRRGGVRARRCRRCVEALVARGLLRRRPGGWYWTRADRATDHVSLRGSGEVVRIVERRTGRVLGTVDGTAAHGSVHTGRGLRAPGADVRRHRARPRGRPRPA